MGLKCQYRKYIVTKVNNINNVQHICLVTWISFCRLLKFFKYRNVVPNWFDFQTVLIWVMCIILRGWNPRRVNNIISLASLNDFWFFNATFKRHIWSVSWRSVFFRESSHSAWRKQPTLDRKSWRHWRFFTTNWWILIIIWGVVPKGITGKIIIISMMTWNIIHGIIVCKLTFYIYLKRLHD